MRVLLTLTLLLLPTIALAHATLVYPPPRTTSLKQRHCGLLGSTRGTAVTTLAPGAVITVQWRETIDHPGHYRISFDDDGQDFTMPPADPNANSEGTPTVVKDQIADIQGALPAGGRPYSQQITLPNIECNNCTLQLVQYMTDKAPYDPNDPLADDIYFQCADITLSNGAPMVDAGMTTEPDAPPGGGGNTTSGGCSTGNGASLGIGLALLGLVTRRRRG